MNNQVFRNIQVLVHCNLTGIEEVLEFLHLFSTEDVVEDDPGDDWQPPPIFISYQWAHQQEVKLLKKHLEMAGYKRSANIS